MNKHHTHAGTRLEVKSGWRRMITTTLVAIIALMSGAALAVISLGGLTFSYAPARTLDGPHLGQSRVKPASIAEAVDSFGFVSAVGGVAFGGTGSLQQDHELISLRFDPDQADGRRLRVVLKTPEGRIREVAGEIPDWQLLPIARFAGADEIACFTLFGRLQDEAKGKELLSKGAKILNYHSAFEDTLLGLRLMQADLLILYPDCAALPGEGGQPFLGAGESAPDLQANEGRLRNLHEHMTQLNNRNGGPFQSYVICDHKRPVTIGVQNDVLNLTGSPVWHCWRSKLHGKDNTAVQNAANTYANGVINAKPQELANMSREEIEQKFHKLWDEYVSERLLEKMPGYSQSLTEKIVELEGINPAVYAALTRTMRYSAFFRFARKQTPDSWAKFAASLPKKLPSTRQTPTILMLPGR